MSRFLRTGFFALMLAGASLPAVADESGPPPEAAVPVVASAPVDVIAHRRAKAPADEYFGRLKLSILGVRNLVYDIDARADNATEEVAANYCHKLIFAEDALHDWQAKYPDDAWVPKFGYAMLKDYETIDSDMIADESHAASIHAIDLANWLSARYPDSEFAPKQCSCVTGDRVDTPCSECRAPQCERRRTPKEKPTLSTSESASERWISRDDVHKVNTNEIDEITWASPRGRFVGAGKQISEALGRKPKSLDLNERHPFDVELLRIPPGATPYPFHSHSAQWEFYHVVSGSGVVRYEDGTMPIVPGDAFIFKPGEAHQVSNDSANDLILYVVADNPIGEHHYFPDSKKWGIGIPQRRFIRSEPLDYFDGEE